MKTEICTRVCLIVRSGSSQDDTALLQNPFFFTQPPLCERQHRAFLYWQETPTSRSIETDHRKVPGSGLHLAHFCKHPAVV